MSNSSSNTLWQVSYWTKMAYQRNVGCSSQSEEFSTKNPNYNTTIVGNHNNESNISNDRISFAEENKEFLNPLTKHWRESLRTYKQTVRRYSSAPKQTNKQWLEEEYRKEGKKDAQKIDVLDTFKISSRGFLSKSNF